MTTATARRDTLAAIAQDIRNLSTVTIDLDAFLALDSETRAARWRAFDLAAKFQVCALMLTRKYGDWGQDLVEAAIAHYDAKWACPVEIVTSELAMPTTDELLSRIAEDKAQAEHHGDVCGVRQLDRLRANVLNGARFWWTAGELLIQSVNNPGAVYSVNARGCSCPNGVAGRSDCWHVCLHDLLLDELENRAAARDILADAAAEREQTERELGRRLAEARARMMAAA